MKPTKTNLAINLDAVIDKCTTCALPITVEKEMKDANRKSHCTACLMINRFRIPSEL